jgi:hypothetical protein
VVTPIVSAVTSEVEAPPESTVVLRVEDPSEIEVEITLEPEEGTPVTPLTPVTGPVDQRAALELALQLLAISSGTGEAMARAEPTPPEGSIATAPAARTAQKPRGTWILVGAVVLGATASAGAILRSELMPSGSEPLGNQPSQRSSLVQGAASMTMGKSPQAEAPTGPAETARSVTPRSKVAPANATHGGRPKTLLRDKGHSTPDDAHLTHTIPRF